MNGANGSNGATRLIVVEDHAETAEGLKRFLSAVGYKVFVATDMASALSLAAAVEFDVLVSDLGLPDGTGWELLKRLSTCSTHPRDRIQRFQLSRRSPAKCRGRIPRTFGQASRPGSALCGDLPRRRSVTRGRSRAIPSCRLSDDNPQSAIRNPQSSESHRDPDVKRASSRSAPGRNRSAMRFHDRFRNRQSQTRSVSFAVRNERFENSRQ